MADTIFASSDSSEKAPEKISNLDVSQAASSQPYQLTVKRGFLALFIMYDSQTLVGLGFSYGLRFINGAGGDAKSDTTALVWGFDCAIGGKLGEFIGG